MKPTSPNPDPLDELLTAALHGELTAAERAALDARLAADPAARAAYQEIQHMHNLLEKSYRDAQPDPAFEERMISGVRRKMRDEEAHRETAWESVLILWHAVKRPFGWRPIWGIAGACAIVALLLGVTFGPITNSPETVRRGRALAQKSESFQQDRIASTTTATQSPIPTFPTGNTTKLDYDFNHAVVKQARAQWNNNPAPAFALRSTHHPDSLTLDAPDSTKQASAMPRLPINGAAAGASFSAPTSSVSRLTSISDSDIATKGLKKENTDQRNGAVAFNAAPTEKKGADLFLSADGVKLQNPLVPSTTTAPASAASAEPSRKLVRDARLDLEVASFQKSVDAITALAKADGGYLDSSNSQRGGNGKLQGTVVVKVLPEHLDAFLLKLRDLGEIKNQSVSTEDVTKDYYDMQARLDNSRRMETQLQELLKHDNGKVADLLQVERELGRVRGEIEQMQGRLQLYDFQVQYATVTIALAERDLNQAAAYLLRESDSLSLFAHDVEGAFAAAKTAADASKAQILSADLQHDSGSAMTARLAFSVPPDQIDGFLNRVRALGRVDNFTRQTQRVANDGGEANAPADQTRTEKAPVQVSLAIRADDESARQQTQLAIVSTGDIDTQARQLKADAATFGATVTGSDFQRAPDGGEIATLTFRLPLARVAAFMPALEKLGRVESLTVQRHDQPGQASADANAPAEIDLRLHNAPALENQPPCQQTQLAIASRGDVDSQARQVKLDAVKAGAAVTASSFDRAPDGAETATLSFRLPLSKAPDFMATLEKLGRVESLAVQRDDQPGQASVDPAAPAQIDLRLHTQPALVADDNGLWATLRHTFGHGVEAFLGSVQMIGVIVAFLLPWLAALAVAAWIGRRIYIARKR